MDTVTAPRRHWTSRHWLVLGFALVALLTLLIWNLSLQAQFNTRAAQVAASRENWRMLIRLLNASDVRGYTLSSTLSRGRSSHSSF